MSLAPETAALPDRFAGWFEARGWRPRAHQLAMLAAAQQRRSALLIAPTGGGKTLAGFLPSLVALANRPPLKPGARRPRLHTLYISPLKALAADIARNLETPIAEMGLPIEVDLRTGDTSPGRRARQRERPPDILMTTPEQLALLISYPDAAAIFSGLDCVILDELHALSHSKRGELLALGLARLRRLAPDMRTVGLSATVHDPAHLRRYLMPQTAGAEAMAELVTAQGGARPDISILVSNAYVPWSGHTGRHAMAEVYQAIKAAGLALIFVNTRSQAELVFQELWRRNDDNLPIALHHGSLAREQRERVEAAMAAGRLKAVVCTSTLDLGIDWGDVDLVINLGAPKGASRLLQRIGRANHRLDEPSAALLVPANRFEYLECEAARQAAREGVLDGNPPREGGLDVLAQHVLGMACSGPFHADDLYAEVISAEPYAQLDRQSFEDVVEFVANGGYALKAYDRFQRIVKRPDGRWHLASGQIVSRYRLNIGTIIEAPMLKVRLTSKRTGRGGRVLGEIEEWFVEQLRPGDAFVFAGEVLAFEGLQDTDCIVSRASAENPIVPSYAGGKFPLSTYLAERVRHMIADPTGWDLLPGTVVEWLEIQRRRSVLPRPGELLVETFPRAGKHYLVTYPFDGRLAHQTLGMLMTRRLERAGMKPMGFVCNDYALSVWGLEDMGELPMEMLFDEDMLGDDLEAWLDESALLKRTFRQCAVIAGLIERRFPGEEKSGRQVTFSSDLIYDVLRAHEPNHVLLRATRADAAQGLLDIRRLGDLLARAKGAIRHVPLARVSPMAVPIMLEIGREPVHGDAGDALIEEVADALIQEATRLDDPDLDGAGERTGSGKRKRVRGNGAGQGDLFS